MLLPLARELEGAGRALAASLLYRALLDSILRRGNNRNYAIGARYLQKLDALAPDVGDWGSFTSHKVYQSELRLAHGRKTSFWSKYERH